MNYSPRTPLFLPAIALALGLAANSPAANLVTNGDFETGDLTGWTASTNAANWSVFSAATSPNGKSPSSGTYFVQAGCIGDDCINGTPAQQDFLFQDIATTPGDSYTLTFAFESSGTPMELEVLFGGDTVFDLTGLPNETTYTQYSA